MARRRTAAALALAAATLAAAGCGSSADKAAKGNTIVSLRVIKFKGQVLALVPVQINGHAFTFALDTGAAGSLIDSQAAKLIEIPKTGSKERGAGVKCTFTAAKVKVTSWRVGTIKLPAATIVSVNLPFGNAHRGVQGLLGSDMLSRFDTVTIDYDHGILKLHARPLA
jgi:hypothetical protein